MTTCRSGILGHYVSLPETFDFSINGEDCGLISKNEREQVGDS